MPAPKRKGKDWTMWTAGIIYFVGIPLLLVVLFLFSDMVKQALMLHPANPSLVSIPRFSLSAYHVAASCLQFGFLLFDTAVVDNAWMIGSCHR